METIMSIGAVAPMTPASRRRYHGVREADMGIRVRRRSRERTDIEQAIAHHANTVMRVCALYLREPADRDDAFQETFLRYARYGRQFNGDEHRKAWLIRVAANVCKDLLKRSDRDVESLETLAEDGFVVSGDDGEEGQRQLEREDVLKALQSIEERYAVVLYLTYYENYTAAQIGRLLDMPENTVYTHIARGKRQLKGVLGHE